METIFITFSKSRKKLPIFGWLIQWYLKTPYSHVALKFYSTTLERTLVYELISSGTRFTSLEHWKEKAQAIKTVPIQVTPEEKVELLRLCVDLCTDYGMMQNIGLVIADLLKLKDNPFKKKANCSEVIAKILIKKGYKFFKPVDLITPKDIYEVLSI